MYVCLCRGITDNEIRQAVAEGATSMRALRQCLGVCTECGKCGACARDVLRETLDSRHPAPPDYQCDLLPAATG